MLRVLQISNYMYPHIGGIEQTARDILSILKECSGVEQKVICFNEDASSDDVVDKREETVHEEIDGVEVVKCGCFTKLASQSISIPYPKELALMLDTFKPDLIILHYPNPYVTHFLLKYKKRDFKLCVYWHLDITKQKLLKVLFNSQNRELLKRADRIVATSPNYIEGSPWLQMFKEKCIVIPSCINTERLIITPQIEEKAGRIREENKNKTICVSVGRFVEYKGFSYLIKASELLDESYRFYMIGSGELDEKLKKEAEGNEKIVFTGRLSDEDLKAYLLACDIFCFPSITKNEAFGLALAEAMYYGKPAVTFTIPGSGVNYVSLDKVTGIEVPNRDTKAYAEALKTLHEDGNLRKKYGDDARKRVEENFLKEKFSERIKSLIGEFSN